MKKSAAAGYVIHPLLAERWSPRAFEDKKLEPEAIRSLLEAARWAPSCFNAQPWRFVLGLRPSEDFDRVLSCLVPSNQAWASKAGMLMIAAAKKRFDRNDNPNRHAWHDVGLAVAQLTMQATSMDLVVHQMAGIDTERARDVLHIPEGYEPITGIAVGHPMALADLPEEIRDRETAPRTRLFQSEFVFRGAWNRPVAFDEEAAAERVLSFWFGEPDEDGLASTDHLARWWKKDASFDEQIRSKFADEHRAISDGRREGWLNSARGSLAYVIVLDQFSRNMFRNEPGMFASDEKALETARKAIDLGIDKALKGDMRAFFYLPLMHSEELADQERCVALFQSFVGELKGAARDRFASNLKFAIAHRDIVAKWGRFPHRNAILGRPSTPEELAFLEKPGSSF